jgi:hypothetical protein
MKTGLRVHNGEGDRRSGVSMTCISLTTTSMVERCLEVLADNANLNH